MHVYDPYIGEDIDRAVAGALEMARAMCDPVELVFSQRRIVVLPSESFTALKQRLESAPMLSGKERKLRKKAEMLADRRYYEERGLKYPG